MGLDAVTELVQRKDEVTLAVATAKGLGIKQRPRDQSASCPADGWLRLNGHHCDRWRWSVHFRRR